MAGRKRKLDPRIPSHIDQEALPRGVYWDPSGHGRWYRYVLDEGVKRKRVIGGPNTRLSQLHAAIEADAGPARGTLDYAHARFLDSTEYAALAAATKRDYRIHGDVMRLYRLRDGRTLGVLPIDQLRVPNIQAIVEAIAKGKPESRPGADDAIAPAPSKANHGLRYLRRLFAWAIRHDCCQTNPAQGVRQAKELGAHNMPAPDAFDAVLAFAADRGARTAHTEGSVAPYLAPVMTIAYGVRLRGIEVITLTDANALPDGIRSNRRKGSRDNVTRWNPSLRAAWDTLVAQRQIAIARTRRPTPLKPEQRQLVVNEQGTPLLKSSFDSAWQRMIGAAVDAGVITDDQRFSLHGLKHRGITDSSDKAAGGHRSEAMRQRYNHDVPLVDASGTAVISGANSGAKEKGT